MPGRRVDFVGVDVFRKSFVDGLVEAGEQVGHGFVGAAEEHGYGTLPVSSHGDAASGMEHADRDMAVANQISDVGQIRRDEAGVVGDDLVVQAAVWFVPVRLAAMFQGSNSSMRVMGWSAMRDRTSRK